MRDVTLRPTISRQRRSPVWRRSVAAAREAASPARRSSDNVLAGARLAAGLDPELVVFDGSGAAIPPVATDARILVVNGAHDIRAGLNAYRVLVSDLVVDAGGADRKEIAAIADVPVVSAELRLQPMEPLAGRRTAVFTTGPAPTDELDAEVVHVSRNLANRDALRAELETIDAEVYLVELKAAAIDVVAETRLRAARRSSSRRTRSSRRSSTSGCRD